MAFKQADKDKIKALGFDVDKFIAAAKDEKEVDFAVPEGTIFTDQQLADRDGVKLTEGKKEGEKSATTIAKAEIKKHVGIDITGDRWAEIGTQLKTAINASNDAKITSLTEQNTKLLADKEGLTTQLAQEQATTAKTIFDGNVMSKLPGIAPGFKSLNETLQVARLRGYEFENTPEGGVVKVGGAILSDPKTHKPMPLDAAIKHIYETEKWNTPAPAGGRGGRQGAAGGSGGATGIMTKSAAMEQWAADNPDKSIATPEGQAWYTEVSKVDGFDYYA